MKYLVLILCFFSINYMISQDMLLEAESFDDKGGWVVDPQFIEQMGSSYLLAHGMGEPVKNAKTEVNFKKDGEYKVWVRTKNWVPGEWKAPGRFQIKVNGLVLENTLGLRSGWGWEYAGAVQITNKKNTLELVDLTGFNGRCDAIYFTTSDVEPPSSMKKLATWRKTVVMEPVAPKVTKKYDLVVVGGGIAGCAAAIAAAEEGLQVALIHDRPVLGGNASSEIRVHTLGIYGNFERILKKLDTEHYPNGSPEAHKDQIKRDNSVKSYENISLFLNWRAYDAKAVENKINYVDARQTATGERIRFEAPLFVDSTGDGWIGFWAGAEFSYGRESVDKYGEEWKEHGELWSPKQPDNAVMGSSVLWRSYEAEQVAQFPEVPWAMPVARDYAKVKGEWQWEFSRNDLHQIDDAEEIRDHMLRAIYGSFANAKKQPENANRKLEWVSYLVGKRESRRLVGDYIFTLNDAKTGRTFTDGVVEETREVDVHYQTVLEDEKNPDFISEALFYKTPKYYIPYRSLYSKNINNLFMAGRNFSTSHVGLGGPRVMRTTGQMGAAVGFAASLCKKYDVSPRDIYTGYLNEYMDLIEKQKYTPIPDSKK
ncbi:FAD-dependent oxidoreductase [Arenibacter troitsensis]|uniref:FAD dependent oxidoreductase n=1 Tax=Arenibacter troitsensis TaxID=188872 RepID=A0A1X7LIG2_9FLAO|nr:FAD-dependent oxidoreductase [Arenibacter troitsensis]MDX1768272.1 FAD-dependent oxidoreductase [Arenibacter troitsensis]SMG53274.1 FAD dependent oxidoreductase [Arenibacter troitsensis]